MKYWPKLGYPQTGNLEGLKPTWANSRRPAYVVLKLNNGSGSLCPVAAYHAPSKEVRAYWGALMGGLAREVYVVDGVDGSNKPTPKAKPVLVDYGFFGGDFNYEVIKGWPGAYGYFISQSNKNDLGGADQRTVPAPSAAPEDRRTTVQLMGGQFHKDPIDKPTADAYLRYEIDLGFHRKVDSIQARRVDLLNEVMMNSGSYDTPLSQTAAYMKYLQDNIKRGEQRLAANGPEQLTGKRRRDSDEDVYSPMISGSWGGTFLDWRRALRQYTAKRVTSARCAAEYIHLFVSDHLPLIATITFDEPDGQPG